MFDRSSANAAAVVVVVEEWGVGERGEDDAGGSNWNGSVNSEDELVSAEV